MMTLKDQLFEKVNKEYEAYLTNLKSLSVDEVIRLSYETSMKKDF